MKFYLVSDDDAPEGEILKRYFLFGGEFFYARGGWHDFLGDFDTIDDAAAKGRELWKDTVIKCAKYVEWWHVVDTKTGRIVAGTRQQALWRGRDRGGGGNPSD